MLTDLDNNVAYQEALLAQKIRKSVERDINAWQSALPKLINEENRLKDSLHELCGKSGHDWGVENIQNEKSGTNEVLVKAAWENFDGEGNDIPAKYEDQDAYKKVMVKACRCCSFRSVRDAKLKVTERYI